jgi:LPXTG-motif cell wall-anchored protein
VTADAAAELPQTGAELSGILPLALALMALGSLLMLGTRRLRTTR